MTVKLASAEIAAQIKETPVVLVDGWTTFGVMGGLVDITFVTNVFLGGDPNIHAVPCARLRFNMDIARALWEALDEQINPPSPPKSEVN